MQKFSIRDWRTGEIIHEGEAESFKEFVEKNKKNLRNANLRNADFERVNLRNADLESANLRNADLESANLERVNLRNADLQGANLRNADLQGANLRNADLQGANLKGANLAWTYLQGACLENSKISIYSKQSVSIKLLDSNIEKQNVDEIKILIGCKTKTIPEWDKWFASNKEYKTSRGTFEFKQIQGMYEAYRAYIVRVWS